MEVIITKDARAASHTAARVVARLVRAKPDAVLGLATGSTPLKMYQELARMHVEDGLDFSRVTTFNLDEYVGLEKDHPQSYHTFMRENFFRHVNVPMGHVHVPNGATDDVPGSCADYEKRIRDAGGIDLQVLGIGTDGHVGFNEPTSSLASRTRIKTLTTETLNDNARFFDRPENQPHHVITMGIGTIMESRQVLIMAFGERKAHAAAVSIEGPVSSMMPASALQFHPKAHFLMDEPAAGELIRADYYRWVYDNKPEWQQY